MVLPIMPQPNDSVWNLQFKSQIQDPNSPTYNPNSLSNIMDRRQQGTTYAQPDYSGQNDAIGRRLDTINSQGDQQNAFNQQSTMQAQQTKQNAVAMQGQQTYNAALTNQNQARASGYQNQYAGVGTGGFNSGLAPGSLQAYSTDPARNGVVNSASQQAGTPYQWGGTSKSGFDCSGLVQYVYKGMGIALPRTSQQQATMGTQTSIANLKPGDLVAWGNSPSTATHIAIYAGGSKIWEAAHAGSNVRTRAISANEAGIMGISLNI